MPSFIRRLFLWLGFLQLAGGYGHDHAHDHHGSAGHHGHTHGIVDPTIATSERGIWAVKWSFVVLAITAALQFAVVIASGS
ncbi:MAG TPA: cation transporter, partial [Bradyrhizobium sp.]|nr:cation transporter [Bradyrhizobium sp.]